MRFETDFSAVIGRGMGLFLCRFLEDSGLELFLGHAAFDATNLASFVIFRDQSTRLYLVNTPRLCGQI